MYKRKEDSEKIGEEYQRLTESVLSKVEPSQRENVMKILYSENAVKQYQIMREDTGLTPRQIRNIMTHNLSNFAKGKGITVGRYTAAMAEELTKLEDAREALDEMYHEKIISRRIYEDAIEEIHGQIKHSTRTASSTLEEIARKAAAVFVMILGIAIVLSSSSLTITGATIGTTSQIAPILVIGFVLFVIGLVIYPRK